MENYLTASLFQKEDNFFETLLDDLLVLLHPEKDEYYTFNESAQVLWHCLEKPCSIDDASHCLQNSYHVAPKQSRNDVLSWFKIALEKGLIKKALPEQAKPIIHAGEVSEKQINYVTPRLDSFELLKHVAGGACAVAESGDGVLIS